MLPVRDAGLLDTPDVPDDGLALTSEVRLVPTPGHTPGHVSVELRSGDETALISGDAVHHPVQLRHPEIGSCVDVDPAQARRTRDRLLAWVREHDALLLGTPFPEPTGMHLPTP
ncbi:MBL fold metallo-hydrolase [Actinomycetospora soli]|uniref:MBL fold metallo-hydrolase n=1 Tax=Actinomycetospora soli TaxID=2893887 RepID=UPI0027E36410|nr:MBL fold metallo-hydrolase [Actinomycetospora soli]